MIQGIIIGAVGTLLLLQYEKSQNQGLQGIRKSRWIEPYNNNRATIPHKNFKKPGVYLIKSKRTGQIKYVGYSSNNLYRTIYRHFQTWNDSKQPRYVYDKNGYLIRVISTTPKKAAMLEQALINKYNPPDNKNKNYSIFDSNKDMLDVYADFVQSKEPLPF